MIKTAYWVFALLVAFGLIVSCSNSKDGENSDSSDADVDNDTDADTDADSDSDTDADSDSDTDADSDEFQSCGTTSVNLTGVTTRVMLLLDKSLSMNDNNKWNQAVSAINGMVQAFNSQIEFGIDLFAVDGDGEQASCAVGTAVAEDSALENAADIVNLLGNTAPAGATPLLLGMRNFLDRTYAPAFSAAGANGYLVIVSDGMDTCGENGVYNRRGGADEQELAAATASLYSENGIGTIVIGFGDGADPTQLNAIANAGGTEFTTYLDAADGAELDSTLNNIAETVVTSCLFQLDNYDPEQVNTDRVNVLFDGTAIPRDEECRANTGWMWADESKTSVQFCEAACNAVESGTVSNIEVQVACSDDDVVIITPI